MGLTLKDRRKELTDILPNLRRFALSLTGNLADADDLLQATVESVLERGAPDDAELLPWCLTICRNRWIDELRSRKVRQDVQVDDSGDGQLRSEDAALSSVELEEVRSTLASMPEEQRSVLLLVAVEGYAYREAAELLDVPIGTVMSRLSRARAALADAMDEPE